MRQRSNERRSGKVAVLVIAATVLVAAGAVVGQYLLPSAAPESLRSAQAETSFKVEQASFDDERTVQLALNTTEDQKLAFPVEGRVTQTSCVAGTQIVSGQVVAEVSGKRILALHTAIPLWESLEPGSEGDVVDALRAELIRQGADLAETGPVNNGVLNALEGLLAAEGETPVDLREVPADQIMWIPQVSVTMLKCAVHVADEVKAGDEFGVIAGSLVGAQISPMPSDLPTGERVLKVAGLDLPVDASGAVSSPEALSGLAATADFQAMRSAADTGGDDAQGPSAPSMVAELVLASPVTVWAVPASTVYQVSGGTGCISSRGKGLPVNVVGSTLGKTYVVPHQEDTRMPAKVNAPGPEPASCTPKQ